MELEHQLPIDIATVLYTYIKKFCNGMNIITLTDAIFASDYGYMELGYVLLGPSSSRSIFIPVSERAL